MKTTLTLLLAVLLPLAVHAADDLTSALQKGLFEEEANQNLPAAIKAYESLLAASDEQRKLAATALFRLGECYRKLGKTNDAVAQYQRLLRDYADQGTLATLSRQNLRGLGTESANTVGSTIRGAVAGADSTASAEAIRAEALLAQLKQMHRTELLKVMPTVAPDALLSSLLERLAETQRKLASARTTFNDEHPTTKASIAELKILDEQIVERLQGILQGLEIKATALKQQAAVTDVSGGMGRGGGAAAPINEEEQEVRRIQALIKDSPDLINAVNVEVAKVKSGESMVPKNGTLLHKAANQGQLGVARFLIEHGADVAARDEMGRTPLHRAAGNGHRAMVELLLANKADANATVSTYPDNGSTSLHMAVSKGYRSVCELLLARGANPNLGDASVNPPIYPAVWADDVATVRLLLAKGAKVNPEPGKKGYTPLHSAKSTNVATMLIEAGAVVDALNDSNQSPLHYAAGEGRADVVAVLLAAGANPNHKDKDGKTALFRAAWSWKANAVAPLIAKGANPNERNVYGGVPLDELIRFSDRNSSGEPNRAPQLETLQAFLAGGADPNLTAVGSAPHLFRAVREGSEDQVEELLKAGADPNAKSDHDHQSPSVLKGQTPLIRALRGTKRPSSGYGERTRSMAMVNLLLEHKADVNLADGNGDEPIFFAMNSGSKEFSETAPFIEALLKRGADIEARNSAGESPLSLAVVYHGKEMVELLLKHKADPNAKVNNGKSPLHLAAMIRSMELVEILIAAGADANALDAEGRSALDYAKASGSSPQPEVFRSRVPSPVPNFPGQASSPPMTAAPNELADRLRKAGARDWAPRPGLITVTRRSTGASQVIFTKGTNDWNRHSLIELLAFTYFGSDTRFPFPDFSQLLITRRDPASGEVKEFKVDLAAALAKDGCKADQWLEWGDLVEIPEGVHRLDEKWSSLPSAMVNSFEQCIARKVTLKAGGVSKELGTAAGQNWNSSVQNGTIRYTRQQPPRLRSVVLNSGQLLTSSDLSKVMVTRSDAKDGFQEWTFDLTKSTPEELDLWLREGDQIEVPEKDPASAATPTPAGETSPPDSRTIPPRPRQIRTPAQPQQPLPAVPLQPPIPLPPMPQ